MAKYVHVVMKCPKERYKLLPHARLVLDSLLGNERFPVPSPPLPVFAAHIKALDEAETDAHRRMPGAPAERDAAREVVRTDLHHLRDYVQSVVDGLEGPADLNAIRAMVESVAMRLRLVVAPAKAVFAVKYGGVPGSVKLTAPASRARDTHEWQYSVDQESWLSLQSTRQASTTATGLAIGVTHYFRHRMLTKDGHTEWSDPVIMIVVR